MVTERKKWVGFQCVCGGKARGFPTVFWGQRGEGEEGSSSREEHDKPKVTGGGKNKQSW